MARRIDGRAPDVLRPVKLVTDFTDNPLASVLVEFGATNGSTNSAYDTIGDVGPNHYVQGINGANLCTAGTCSIADTPNTTSTATTTPAVGEVLYYVVVAETDCGVGTAGRRSGGLERSTRVCR